MLDKNVLITGANSGIGFETAMQLAKMGAKVILVTRQEKSGQVAQEEIITQSGNKQINHYTCDLASLNQVRILAEQLHTDFDHLDVLLNNAGIITQDRKTTEEGFEYQFGVNHLSHFLLTQLTIDLLRKSDSARIINVSSMAHKMGKINFTDINLENGYTSFKAYAQSKLANILFTYGLCSRVFKEGLTSNALHPGVVGSRFGAGRNGNKTHPAMKIYQKLALSPEKGAETSIYLASSPEVEQKSGGYYVRKKASVSSKSSYDPDAATALWEMSLRMTGLTKSLI